MTALQKLNAELAWRAFDTARAHGGLNMDVWASRRTGGLDRDWLTADRRPAIDLTDLTNGSATACLAGWACALAGYVLTSTGGVYAPGGERMGSISHVATDLLGLDSSQALFLFTSYRVEAEINYIFGPRPAESR